MKLPRGVDGYRVVRVLERLGYELVRQKGSHVGMRHEGPPTLLPFPFTICEDGHVTWNPLRRGADALNQRGVARRKSLNPANGVCQIMETSEGNTGLPSEKGGRVRQ